MTKILQQDNKVLRQIAEAVGPELFDSPELKKIVSDMSAALAKEDDGVAIAAPQIGISKRIFVVSGKLWTEENKEPKPDLVFINPVISKMSKKMKTLDEGCLSVRWLYGKTKRADKVTLEAQNIEGEKFSWNAAGLLAQIFQHETDHLNGILFIDHATNIEEILPEK